MMKVIEYVFYRIYFFYKKKDSDPVFAACMVLATILFFNILDIFSFLHLLLKFPIKQNNWVIIIILMILLWLVWKYFNSPERITKLEERYKDEEVGVRKRKGVLIVLYLIVSILIPISIGIMRHNLGMAI